jgi:hypothetical protein
MVSFGMQSLRKVCGTGTSQDARKLTPPSAVRATALPGPTNQTCWPNEGGVEAAGVAVGRRAALVAAVAAAFTTPAAFALDEVPGARPGAPIARGKLQAGATLV